MTTSTTPFVWRDSPNGAFDVGESIVFDIKYGVIQAGTATLEVKGLENVGGRPAYHVLSLARSSRAMDAVFKVRDRNESWIDVQSLCSLRFHQDMREGFYKRRVETVYDHPAGRFLYKKWRKGREYVYDGAAPAFVQDVLSSLYYIRTFPLIVGSSHTLSANSGSDSWPMTLHVLSQETVDVPAGRFVCFRLEPVLAGEGLFHAKGKLEVWVTADDRRIPVLLRSKVMIGSFDAEMSDYTPGGGRIPTTTAPPPVSN